MKTTARSKPRKISEHLWGLANAIHIAGLSYLEVIAILVSDLLIGEMTNALSFHSASVRDQFFPWLPEDGRLYRWPSPKMKASGTDGLVRVTKNFFVEVDLLKNVPLKDAHRRAVLHNQSASIPRFIMHA